LKLFVESVVNVLNWAPCGISCVGHSRTWLMPRLLGSCKPRVTWGCVRTLQQSVMWRPLA